MINDKLLKSAAAAQAGFAAVEYSGNSTTQTITGVGFEPDILFICRTDGTGRQYFFMRADHASNTMDWINFGTTEGIQTGNLIQTNNDGWTMGYSFGVNYTGLDYIAFCWRVNGDNWVNNTDGDITSRVSANQDTGISIVNYTGSGTSGNTIGHGLGGTPDIIMFFENQNGNNKIMEVPGSSKLAFMNLPNDWTTPYCTSVGASTFEPNTGRASQAGNDSGREYIAVCMKSIPGLSKIGVQTGTTSAVNRGGTLDFEPKFFWTKNMDLATTNGSSYNIDWLLYDEYRSNGATTPFQTNDEDWNASRPDITFNANTVRIATGTGSFSHEYAPLNFYNSPMWYMIYGVS